MSNTEHVCLQFISHKFPTFSCPKKFCYSQKCEQAIKELKLKKYFTNKKYVCKINTMSSNGVVTCGLIIVCERLPPGFKHSSVAALADVPAKLKLI